MNTTKSIVLALCLMAAGGACAQQSDGGISADMLSRIRSAQSTAADKALFNAIASNKIDDIAFNFANSGDIDTHFSVETPK